MLIRVNYGNYSGPIFWAYLLGIGEWSTHMGAAGYEHS